MTVERQGRRRSRAPQRDSLLWRIMTNPFIGFAPWVALGIIEGPGRLVPAIVVALAMSVAFLAIDLWLGMRLKILAVIDVAAFAAFAVIATVASDDSLTWLEVWFGELANILLLLVVAGSMLVGVPFTIQYAKEQTDPDYWDTPVFRRINYVITGVWGAAFGISAVAGFYGDYVLGDSNNIWTGWVIQVYACLIAYLFTQWYPDYAAARALQSIGEPTEPPPPIAAFLAPTLGCLVPIGVASWTLGWAPNWVGIALAVVGAAGYLGLRPASGRPVSRP